MIITELSTSAARAHICYGSGDGNTQQNNTATGASLIQREHKGNHASNHPPIDDIITEDGILCLILSKLTLREAVGTCVLSPRWRHLWTYLPNLTFRVKTIFDAHTASLVTRTSPVPLDEKLQLLEEKTDKFVQAVDTIMGLHQACDGLDQFEFRYFIHQNHFHRLDEWIRASLSSKTKLFALHLTRPFHRDFHGEKYQFNFPHLRSSSYLEKLTLVSCSLKLPYDFGGLTHLKNLELYAVDISEDVLTRLLSNCSTLERFWLQGNQKIVTLTLPQPQNRLHYLSVHFCFELKEININAVNLNRLCFDGYPVDFRFKQSTQLKHASVLFRLLHREQHRTLDYYLNKVVNDMPHLHYLSFIITNQYQVPDPSKRVNCLSHLTSLDLCWDAGVRMSLLQFATVLDACPVLEDLNLRLFTKSAVEEPPQSLQKLRKKLPKHPYSHLRTIQFKDFYCDKWRIELALYLLKNATKLELMTLKKGPMGLDEMHLRNLREAVPAKVELVVL